MKPLLALMLFMTFFAHAADPEPVASICRQQRQVTGRAQYFLADSWLSAMAILNKAEYWAQKPPTVATPTPVRYWRKSKITNCKPGLSRREKRLKRR